MANNRFTVTLEGNGSGSAYAHERVLVALERAQGLGQLTNMPHRLPVGCRRGGCGVCRVQVLGGDYRSDPMSRAHVSIDDEAAGLVLACCIYALSDLSLRLTSPAVFKRMGQQASDQL